MRHSFALVPFPSPRYPDDQAVLHDGVPLMIGPTQQCLRFVHSGAADRKIKETR